MPSSHTLDRVAVMFDDDHGAANAGLLLTASLAQHLGLEELADEVVRLEDRPGHAERAGRMRVAVEGHGRRGSAMAHTEGDVVIARPREVVFDTVADQRNEPRYNPKMLRATKLTDGPIGVGTRFAATVQTGRREADMTIELTVFDRPRRLSSTTVMASMDIEGSLSFDPDVAGTRMHWSWDIHPRGPLRAVDPIVSWVGARNERRIWEGLKRHLEAAP